MLRPILGGTSGCFEGQKKTSLGATVSLDGRGGNARAGPERTVFNCSNEIIKAQNVMICE